MLSYVVRLFFKGNRKTVCGGFILLIVQLQAMFEFCFLFSMVGNICPSPLTCHVFHTLLPQVYFSCLQLSPLFLSHAAVFLLSSPLCATGIRRRSVTALHVLASRTQKTPSRAETWQVFYTFRCSSMQYSWILFIVLYKTALPQTNLGGLNRVSMPSKMLVRQYWHLLRPA